MKHKKILYLTKYTDLAASSRMRSYQYFPFLKEAGMEIQVHPFFNDRYLEHLYQGKKDVLSILMAYLRRFFVLFKVGNYDLIVIEKEIFPYFPAWAEYLLNSFGIRYIVDYDDAIFHNYDQSKNPILKFFLKHKIANVMKYSSCVVAGNSYLAEHAKKAGAKRIEIIPTVINLDRYTQKDNHYNEKFIFGWIGTKSTFEKHLAPQKDWIVDFLTKHPDSEFHIIGIPQNQQWHERVQWIPWSESTEISSIQNLDVGLMPLQDSLWEKGKCAYKLIQYAACGIPGIASDVGMNKDVTISGETGYLVHKKDEWIKSLKEMKNNVDERQNLGKNARQLIEEKFCIQVTSQKWIKLINEVS